MSTQAHTPGPWIVAYGLNGRPRAIHAPKDKGVPGAVGHVVRWNGIGLPSSPVAHANALLIAAAPDMLAACKEFVRKVDAGEARSTRSYEQMKAAVAKAEGRS